MLNNKTMKKGMCLGKIYRPYSSRELRGFSLYSKIIVWNRHFKPLRRARGRNFECEHSSNKSSRRLCFGGIRVYGFDPFETRMRSVSLLMGLGHHYTSYNHTRIDFVTCYEVLVGVYSKLSNTTLVECNTTIGIESHSRAFGVKISQCCVFFPLRWDV